MATVGDQRRAGGVLPVEAGPLVGREVELRRIAELLASEDVRLITLTGPGGVGKSRLGRRVAADNTERFADGVAYASLGALDDPLLLADVIAVALGVADSGDLSAIDRVLAHLRARETLLLLDGFEQLLEAAGTVAELLAACPQLKLLVTSRAALEIAGEHEFHVPPLTPPRATDDPETLLSFPAAELFVQRATAVDDGFRLTPESARPVAEICRRLDGLPLAIELAAARIRVLAPDAMARRLDHPLELLTAGRRDAPQRQRTMRETIAWSYDLLAPDQQRLFRLLSVFAGGFTIEALESVAASHGDALELTGALLSQSMLVRAAGDAEQRLGMLDTLREYASEMLDAAGERAEVEDAHSRWCMDLAQTAERELWGPEQRTWMSRLERELPNLRAAFRRLVDGGRPAEAGEIAVSLERFWTAGGHLSEGRTWLAAVVDAEDVDPSRRARLLAVAAIVAFYGGVQADASVLAGRALEVARECGQPEPLALVLGAVGVAARRTGDLTAARSAFEESIAILRTLDVPHRLAETLTRFGATALWQSSPQDSIDFGEIASLATEALELSRGVDDDEGVLYASAVLAWSLMPIDEARASAIVEDALRRGRASGARRYTGRLMFMQVMLCLRKGDHAQAQTLLEEGTAIATEHGDRRMIVWFFIPGFARTHFMAGRADAAARLLAAADRALEQAGASMPLWMRADDGGGIDATRSALADPRFDAARAEGAALTIDQALELARTAAEDVGLPDGEDLQELTPREREVLQLLTRELSDAQIAQHLVVSRRTVHAHLRSIYRKLDVSSRAAAARWAAEHSLGA